MKKSSRRERFQKIYRVTGIAAAALIAVCSAVTILKPDRTFSANENRTLQGRPALSLSALADGTFFKDLGSRFSDQFWLRDLWISLESGEEGLAGRRESHGVYIGKDHCLFANPETPDPDGVKSIADAVNAFASKHTDIRVRMMAVPCAAAIYPEKLPSHAPVRDQLADIRSLKAALGSGSSVTFIDPSQVLAQHKKEQLYYRTDHHWTSLGARRVFDGCAGELGIDNPVTTYTRYILSFDFLGTLGSQSGRFGTRDMISIYVPQADVSEYVTCDDKTRTSIYDSSKLKEKDQYQVFMDGNHPVADIRTNAGTGRTLLLFKDSYANSFVQFLLPYYDRILMIDPRYYYDSISSTMSQNKITDVLILYSANTLFTDTSLADCLTS